MEKFDYDLLFSQTPVPLALFSGYTHIVETANPAMLALWGKDKSIFGKPYHAVLSSNTANSLKPYLEKVERTRQATERLGCKILLPRNGDLIESYFNENYTPIINQQGKITGIIVSSVDITSQYEFRTELIHERERCQTAIDCARLGIFDHDLISGRVAWDKRARELFGIYHNEPLNYGHFIEAVHPGDKSMVQQCITVALNKTISQGEYSAEYRSIGLDDAGERWIRASGKVFFDENDTPLRIIGTLMDITKEKRDEELKNNFIATISHELNTPLTSIRAHIQIMIRKAGELENDFFSQALYKTEIQIRKMINLVGGFLNAANFELGLVKLKKQKLDLSLLIKEEVKEQNLIMHSYEFDFSDCPELWVDADPEKITQVLSNLLSNTVRYSPFNKRAEIKCHRHEGYGVVSISDRGIGIKPSDLTSIFKRADRPTLAANKNLSGVGFGLFICAEIIRLHDGKIWAESELGKGSVFYFSLPLVSSQLTYGYDNH